MDGSFLVSCSFRSFRTTVLSITFIVMTAKPAIVPDPSSEVTIPIANIDVAFEEELRVWFERQTSGETPARALGIDGQWTVNTYVQQMYEAVQKLSPRNDANAVMHIRFFDGVPASRNRGPFRWKLHTKRRYDRAEIVFSLPDTIGRDTINDVMAVVSTKTGRKNLKAERYRDFAIFNVSDLIDGTKKRIRLRRFRYGDQKLNISALNNPMLVLYENVAVNPLTAQKNSRRPRSAFFRKQMMQGRSKPMWNNCRRVDWPLPMANFSYNWYIYPPNFNAGYCTGKCPVPMDSEVLNMTNHSFLTHIYHSHTKGFDLIVPKACCRPIAYDPQALVYLNSAGKVTITEFPDMRVTACGCR